MRAAVHAGDGDATAMMPGTTAAAIAIGGVGGGHP
jgi:hypothetical protein